MTEASAASDLDTAWRDGTQALREGRAQDALRNLTRITAAGRGNAAVWTAIAIAYRITGEREAQKAALRQVLGLDPRDLRALIMTGDLYAAERDDRAASSYYGAAVRLAEMIRPSDPGLKAEVTRAASLSARYETEYRDHLARGMAQAGLERPEARRVRQSIDLLLGKQEIYLQQPRYFYFPELPQIAWADRAAFPWLDKVEAATDAIRDDLLRVLKEDAEAPVSAFAPYLQPEPNRPEFTPATGLQGDPAWSAFYLWKSGVAQTQNLTRCPSVAAALADAPLCSIPGRTPSVLFSLLRPGAHIKPHHGFTNARYICHLPLIVPPDCAMRVGPETRPWVEGQACVFDDSIEHEAWNRNAEQLRVVMIFDIWRPELSVVERELVSALLQVVDSYGSTAPPAWDA